MNISFDPEKREHTLLDRGLDFLEAENLFAGKVLEFADIRRDYGELRIITVGYLQGRMMVVVWTPRLETRHIISMRKANDREQEKYANRLG